MSNTVGMRHSHEAGYSLVVQALLVFGVVSALPFCHCALCVLFLLLMQLLMLPLLLMQRLLLLLSLHCCWLVGAVDATADAAAAAAAAAVPAGC